MSKIPSLQSLRNIPELKYVNADNVTRYQAIMKYIYQQYQRLNYWLKTDQIYEGVKEWDVLKNYTIEQCQIDLDQLVEWGNLSSRHDGGRAVTVEEYLRKKFQYLLTPYSIEIERLLENLETVRGYGGSLEPTLFDTIAETLMKIRENSGQYEDHEALELWKTLSSSFQRLNETSVDYIASLQTKLSEELMVAETFLLYKDSLTRYLQDFVQTLQRRSFKIEGYLNQITTNVRDLFLDSIIEDEWRIPKLEQNISKEQYLDELLDNWSRLSKWFVGDAGSVSELILLERSTKDAIVKIVRSALRIQERKRSSISRRKELDYLGQWFYRVSNVEDAHKLAAFTFGIFPTRHLQDEDRRDSDSEDISMWKESPIPKILRSRSRKKNDRHDTDAVADHSKRKEKFRKEFIEKQKEELKFLIEMVEAREVAISELDIISTTTRLQLLQWISRCNASSLSAVQTAEGIEICLQKPVHNERTLLLCEDGQLELMNYKFTFRIINPRAWENLLQWAEHSHN